MKKEFLIAIVFFFGIFKFQLSAQNGFVVISGGKIWGDVEGALHKPKGGGGVLTFEVKPKTGKFVHGFSFGFTWSGYEITHPVYGYPEVQNLGITSGLVYYAPKLLIGNGSFKGFFKGAIGMHFSKLAETMTLSQGGLSTNDNGFYCAIGAGIMQEISPKVFVNLDYGFSYTTNSFYRDGIINSLMLGVGISFD
jgi:hypothetical protein